MHEIRRDQLRAPARVIDIDLDVAYGDSIVDVARHATVWCLVRHGGVVADARFFDVIDDSSISMSLLVSQLSEVVHSHVVHARECNVGASLTVVIPTNRRDNLPTVMKSLFAQTDPEFDVLVVDNSTNGQIAGTITDTKGLTVRYCHEPTPGIARARNAALSNLTTDYVAWIDDDEEADANWVSWIKRGFAHASHPDVVVGAMVPAELETTAQVNFERYGGFNKGRPMRPLELRVGTSTVRDPLYPLPSFGAGGNMAFRTAVLRAVGGFDTRLGSPAIRGGEETRALSELLIRGSTILHWPPAVTWHYHRRTDEELERQFFGYSAGLSAFYVSSMLSSPKNVWRVAKVLPRGLLQVWGTRRIDTGDEDLIDFPVHLLRASRKGLFQGGFIYLREVLRQWRQERACKLAQ